MSFTIERKSPQTAVVFVGENLCTTNASDFQRECRDAAHDGIRHFVLDFGRTNHLDSRGLGVILGVHRHVSWSQGRIMFVNASDQVKEIILLTRANKVFKEFPTIESAIKNVEPLAA